MKEIGSEFHCSNDLCNYYEYISSIEGNKYFLRSGRDALRLIAKNLKSTTILLPSYCCDSMITPFVDEHVQIEYYPIGENFQIREEDLFLKLSKHSSACAILLMSYFGINHPDIIIKKLKEQRKDIEIIEDFTHLPFDIKNNYNLKVDYYIASLRKSMPVTDGGIIITSKNLKCQEIYVPNVFHNNRRIAFDLKRKYLLNPIQNIELKEKFRSLFAEANQSLDEDKRIIMASSELERELRRIYPAEIIERRKENYSSLYHLLNRKVKCFSLLNQCPFMFPILVKNRDYIQSALAKRGIYTQVIWPLNNKQKECSLESTRIEQTILCIPIDQRYDYFDMERIAEVVSEVVEECKTNY